MRTLLLVCGLLLGGCEQFGITHFDHGSIKCTCPDGAAFNFELKKTRTQDELKVTPPVLPIAP